MDKLDEIKSKVLEMYCSARQFNLCYHDFGDSCHCYEKQYARLDCIEDVLDVMGVTHPQREEVYQKHLLYVEEIRKTMWKPRKDEP